MNLRQSNRLPPAGSAALPSPPQTIIDAAIAAPLIRYNRTIAGGAHTDGAWHGGASVTLAVASYAGNSSADARLLQQMRYTLTGGNDISANGGYPSQHERHVTAMFAIARRTPRVWNQLTTAEKTKVDLLMKAAFLACAFTTSDNNPYIKAGTQQYALDGDSNLNRDWNPNYREGMIGGVLVGVAYFGGPDAAIAVLDSYNHTQFVSELAANGLSNAHQTFNWKIANPTSPAPSGTVIQSAIKGYRHYGIALTNYMGIYNRLVNDTFSKNVNAGLNGGAGINGAGRIVSGAEQLPNKGALGMLKEFDSSDAGGPRSSASYAYDGYRPHRSNQLVLIASGLWPKGSADANTAASRMNVGLTDLWYKIEKGYIGYAKGVSQGTFDLTDGTAWGFVYNRSLWEDVLKPYHQEGATVQQPAATPEISPAGGAFVGPVVVTIASPTRDARIYYTVDGNTPTTNSAIYVTPFEMAQSGTVSAIAIAPGFTASPVRSAIFAINNFRSSDQWQNISLPTQKQNFAITFNQTPQTNNIDAVTGLSAIPAATYAELAIIIRFSNTGVVDARNGGAYQAKNVFQYTAGMTYSISITVDFANKRYSATITPTGGKAIVIAENYAWRTEQSAITEISNLAFVASSGTHSISGVTIKARPASPKSLRVVQ